jgi:hypothetical protein
LLFLPLVGYLFNLMVLDHDLLRQEAIANQTAKTQISASRGNIYDRNMNILASSYSVETVYLNPVAIQNYDQDIDLIASGLSRILDVKEDFVRQQAENTKYYYRIIKKKISAELSQEVRDFINEHDIIGIHLEPALRNLCQRGVNEVFCEGGGQLAAALLEQGLVDELILIYAPKVLGDTASVRGLPIAPRLLAAAMTFDVTERLLLGSDTAILLRPKQS